MHDFPILRDIVILLSASIITSIVFHRLKFPTITGFLLGGMLIGPHGIGLIQEKELVDVMAEIGVILLLFTIGIEFSIGRILTLGKRGLSTAILQVLLTPCLATLLLHIFNFKLIEALFFGFVITLSSTAIVLRLYMGRGEMESPQGKLSLGILLTQDMAIIPMVLMLQIFGAGEAASMAEIGEAMGVAILAIAVIIVTAYYIVPIFLKHVVNMKSAEVFTMAGILICLGTAWFSSYFGLSLALGAFIAGIVISESEYSHQLTASVLPFRDIFNAIFFISIGMLLRIDIFADKWLIILGLTVIIIIFKALLITAIIYIMRYPLRIALLTGLGLAEIGEFSFVLLKIGEGQGLIGQNIYQICLSAIVLSMLLTPLLIQFAPAISLKVPDLLPKRKADATDMEARESSVINHVIIAGYGLMGKHLANVLKKTGIPYVILDINYDNIKKAQKDGHSAYYGDTSYAEVLKSVGITAAKVMVFAISDPVGTRRGVKIAKEINPSLHVIVRTKFMAEISELSKLGSDQVIPEEFETSVEVFSRVLKEYKVPVNIIQNQIDLIRLEGYSMLRGISIPMEKMTEVSGILAKSVSESFYVEEGSTADQKSIKDLDIRGAGGASIIAIVRGEKTKTNPPANYVLKSGDILALLGSHAEIELALDILKSEKV